ncbi:winged helix DNA-binding domain-containing protein [Deinococcus roseus]|uniref:Winged helix DNA-binding domain-containing protein n=1 Tax=Deinococcus roseus TaxID=392414 RepID=A0ABQ2D9Y6_9DEIO|nr:winged helix DNA-binding domain-containing protein [Deinococcus roseus]GGJ50909.1 hypothetical protein GCM10008938_41130 [Deinococcus roseus]
MPSSLPMLSLKALNRATLQRQHLIGRSGMPALDMVQHLIGLQAQMPNPPYVGLWTRLQNFEKEDLTRLIKQKQVVRAALMRSTLHLVSGQDYLQLRPLIKTVLERQYLGSHGKQMVGLDPLEVTRAGRELLSQTPLNNQELGRALQQKWPDRDAQALGYAVRNFEGLIHVPPAGTWGDHRSPLLVPGEVYLDAELDPKPSLGNLLLRYLQAFGPATLKDMTVWSGLTHLKPALTEIQPALQVYRDEQGKELFDLAEVILPDPETPIPPKFLPDFDNILLSHADRSRIMAPDFKARVFTSNGIIRATVLIDGFVQGIWKVQQNKKRASLQIEMFQTIAAADQDLLQEEGQKLLHWMTPDAEKHELIWQVPAF